MRSDEQAGLDRMTVPARPRRAVRRRANPARHAVMAFLLTLLAASGGFIFAGTGQESGPPSPVRDQAAAVAAATLLAGIDPEAAITGGRSPGTQRLIENADYVALTGHATRIRIASAGIDTAVLPVGYTFSGGEVRYDTPREAAGQYAGTADPGQSGNLVIGGHVSTRSGAAVFASLPKVAIGDLIEVFSGEQTYRYLVTEMRVVAADATAVMKQTQDARLTLITCFPDRQYDHRLVVIGTLQPPAGI
jgi:LPXTG-site transpeptidase (sortase) family protein